MEWVLAGVALYFVARAIWRQTRRESRPAPSNGRRYYVYEYFNADGQSLYIGKTSRHPLIRGAEHARTADWIHEAVSVRWQEVGDAKDMDAIERSLIRSNRPLRNEIRYTSTR